MLRLKRELSRKRYLSDKVKKWKTDKGDKQ